MREIGFELENVSLHYNDNQGLDMIFRNRSGDIAMIGAYAVLEAKRSGNLSAAKVSLDQLRQGSAAYNLSRLNRYLRSPDPVHREFARMLLNKATEEGLLSLIALQESGRLFEMPSGYPAEKPVLRWSMELKN